MNIQIRLKLNSHLTNIFAIGGVSNANKFAGEKHLQKAKRHHRALEAEIDRLVSTLYVLTEAERFEGLIVVVKGS